jgi:hypothetical protein
MKGVDGSFSSSVVCLFGKKDSVLCDKKFKKKEEQVASILLN